jgi:hypothetical protein
VKFPGPTRHPAVAAKCASEVAQYLYEKRKPTEPIAANATQVIVNGNSPSGEDHETGVQRIQVRSFTPVPALTDESEEDDEDGLRVGRTAPQMYEEDE